MVWAVMELFASGDYSLFQWFNRGVVNPVFDVLMPILSGNPLFKPGLALLAFALFWKGGRRGICFALMLAATLAVGETGTGILKRTVGRPRPYATHPETRMLAGKGLNGSMPSGHAAIWAGAAMVAAAYYPRSRKVLVPLAAGVGISRMYVGVHYPSDVAAGWAWGAFYGWCLPRFFEAAWRTVGTRWFPLWHQRVPSLLHVAPVPATAGAAGSEAERETHWRRLTWLAIGGLMAARLGYLASAVIELSEDEAYQWLWSKHPDFSYYSKPPFIAYAQWIGTHLWGDRELGVRFLAPLLSAATAWGLSGFVARLAGWRMGFFLVAILTSMPLLSVGSIILTVDALTVAFWTLALVAGWQALEKDCTGWWAVVGVGLMGTFLSKYFSPFLIAAFAAFFWIHPPARRHLRRPGPWLALGMNAVALLPVYLWNSRNGWITVTHLQQRGSLDQPWTFRPQFLPEFLGATLGLMNPVFFVGVLLALIGYWRWRPDPVTALGAHPEMNSRDALRPTALRYVLCFGLPVFLFYLAYTLRSRVQPNWVATAFAPLAVFAVLWWDARHRSGSRVGLTLLRCGVGIGLPLVVMLHETNLILKLTGHSLPVAIEPLVRVRGHREAAAVVRAERDQLLKEGRPVRVVADHYGWAGELAFYMDGPAPVVAKTPTVTVLESERPINQIWFWPEYRYSGRPGLSVLYVHPEGRTGLNASWATRFESVTDLGVRDVEVRGRVFHRLHLYACRNQR
jgi:membrane-associated phospholipid phosphatase